MQYDHRKVEKKWQDFWAKNKIYTTPDTAPGKDNFFLLVEFPYPSGNLHVGHWYAFAVPDILARYHRMQGKNVLYPIGFDAFGLPAENAAIKNKLNPRKWTEGNIAYMKKQIQSMGTSFDWSREVATCDPAYYKWTQWLFLQLYKKGLVYQKETAVNWCPKDKTVLANEQVVDGRCERCGTEVQQRQMLQWNIKITDYADRLIDDLAPLDWPEQIKESQRNWIGRSEGAEIDFSLDIDKSIKRFIILHAKGASPDTDFYQWLKKQLEQRGYEVDVPLLPNAEAPDDDKQTEFVLKNCKIDETTALVGHSFGCIVALRLLERGKKAGRVTLVGPGFYGEFVDGKERPTVTAALRKGFDFRLIKQNCKAFVVLHDINDPVIPPKDAEAMSEHLGCTLLKVTANTGHFNSAVEPETLSASIPIIRVFTTRPDTLFGATYLVLAPEHPLLRQGFGGQAWVNTLQNRDEVEKYIERTEKMSDMDRQTTKEKTGVQLKGVEAINPATGEKIPLYIADYVLGHYGTGAIMAVPAHDERDNEFAKKFNLPINQVIQPKGTSAEGVYTGDGTLVNSGKFDGMPVEDGKKATTEAFGRSKKTYRLRDWIVSRQRYWGVPIPMIHCEKCGTVPVPDKDLPVELPEVKDYLPEGSGKSPLAKVKKFVDTKCPTCGEKAERETDTLDTFVDSSWYYLAYCVPEILKSQAPSSKQFLSSKVQNKLKNWMPVDLYSGGAEHTTMHLLYSRFWHKALYDMELVADPEPYTRRMNRSIILGPDGQKMSKSHGNVVDPDEVVARLGADTVRMYLAFVGPYNEVSSFPWNPDGVVGVRRFLERVWRLQEKVGTKDAGVLSTALHKAVKKVGEDIAAQKFNTAISQLMILLNDMEKRDVIAANEWATFLQLLAPFAPHMAEELWNDAGNKKSVHIQKWPQYDEKYLVDDEVTYGIQIDGKTRGEVRVATGADKAVVEKAAREVVAGRLESKRIKRVILVPGRLVNFVLEI